MGGVPDLVSLSMKAVNREVLCGDDDDDFLLSIYDLPSELFDGLLMLLPPLALHKLQARMPHESMNDRESTYSCCGNGKKRGRCDKFNEAWEALFKSRWPDITHIQPGKQLSYQSVSQYELTNDWQGKYWEAHVQNCLDAAVEVALLPSFCGLLSEIQIPDLIQTYIGCEVHMGDSACDSVKLSYHCEQFGCFARCLRLQNVLFCSEICNLLRKSKLESLILCSIKTIEDVDGLCKLLFQNRETIIAIEFINCKLSSTFLDAMLKCLCMNSEQTSRVQHFSTRASSFLDMNPRSLPDGLKYLLTGRKLCSLKFCESHLGRNFAATVLTILLDASSSLFSLDLSENNIAGWLSKSSLSSLWMGKTMRSLSVLNLRGNKLRAIGISSLKDVLLCMPCLESLDISDNPIGDDGIKNLNPYFAEASANLCFSTLKVENCDLSCNGATQLLRILSTFKEPLSCLSLAENVLGSEIATALGKVLGNCTRSLNIKDIGLGSSGFLGLQQAMTKEVMVVDINISNNRGGIEAANFVSKLLLRAPGLVEVDARSNLIPAESLNTLIPALEVSKGTLQRLDLRGNFCYSQTGVASTLSKFQQDKKPIVLLSVFPDRSAAYDHDP